MEPKMDYILLIVSLMPCLSQGSEELETYTIKARGRGIEGSDEQDKVKLDARLGPRVQRRAGDGLVEVGIALDLANVGIGLVKGRTLFVGGVDLLQLRLKLVCLAHGCGLSCLLSLVLKDVAEMTG